MRDPVLKNRVIEEGTSSSLCPSMHALAHMSTHRDSGAHITSKRDHIGRHVHVMRVKKETDLKEGKVYLGSQPTRVLLMAPRSVVS